MNLLLLGGYQFVGRAIIEAAHARGHVVSALNRGNHAPLPGVEHFTSDRADPILPEHRNWDAVIDTSGYLPGHTRIAAERLRDRTSLYVFVSSISVYASPLAANGDEMSPLAQLPDGTDLEAKPTNDTYGALKVLCERSIDELMPGRVLTIRPGFIVGPHDYTDRFNSWVERAVQPGAFVVPGDPAQQPVQMIDARDMAQWMISMIERDVDGVYNATGPDRTMTLLEMANACIAGTGSSAELTIVTNEAMAEAGIKPWEHIPFWIEDAADYGIMQANVALAVAMGLRFRPLSETVRDTYAWLKTSDHERKIVIDLKRMLD